MSQQYSGTPDLAAERAERDVLFRELGLSPKLTLLFDLMEDTAARQPALAFVPLTEGDMPPYMWKWLHEGVYSGHIILEQNIIQAEEPPNKEIRLAKEQPYVGNLVGNRSNGSVRPAAYGPSPSHWQAHQVQGGQGNGHPSVQLHPGAHKRRQTFSRSPLAPPLSAAASWSSASTRPPRPISRQSSTPAIYVQPQEFQGRVGSLYKDPMQHLPHPASPATSSMGWPFATPSAGGQMYRQHPQSQSELPPSLQD